MLSMKCFRGGGWYSMDSFGHGGNLLEQAALESLRSALNGVSKTR